jgi:hypothetical protein
MKKIHIIVFVALVLAGCASLPQISKDTINVSINEYSEHLMHYFENKNDAIVYETINIYRNDKNTGILDRIDSMIIFFFYGIKSEDIAKYNNFKKSAIESKIERLIGVFIIIDETDIGVYLENQDASPSLNDAYWTLYFSTGNTKYLDNLLKIVTGYYNETENMDYYLAARSAMWSITSNMQTFPSVREYIQNNSTLENNIKRYIMNNDPDKIQADTIQFITQQRQNGKW